VARIGFVGLGVMGLPMAGNLVRAGHEVRGYDMVSAACEKFAASGGAVAASPSDAASGAEFLITMLPTSENVEAALCGEHGAFRGMPRGAVAIDMSTINPNVSQRLARRAAEVGIDMLDAPVSRGEVAAIKGDLLIMVGGAEPVFERSRDILGSMGSKIIHVGGSGMGAVAKIVNNIMVGCICAATSEALVFGTKAGAALERLVDVITNASGNSWLLQNQMQPALHGSFEPGFFTDHMYKDLGLALSASSELGVPLRMAEEAQEMFAEVRARGHGKKDYTILLKVLEDAAGVKVRYRDSLEPEAVS
jgi:2-hydroxy-3-oxopropionate reductase